MSSAPALEVRSLQKRYRGHTALSGVDLTVPRGAVYGLLGPNGAGKTTLMKIVLGLQRASGGSVALFGRPHERRLLARVGALVESPGLWPALNADEHLAIHAKLRGVPRARVDEVLARVELDSVRRRKVAQFSLGMRWRLGIAIALLAGPELLLLDEPTNGLDPVGIRQMRSTIRSLADTGTTVLVSSHQLVEIQHVCDLVGVLVEGRTCYEGPVSGLAMNGDIEAGFFALLERTGSMSA